MSPYDSSAYPSQARALVPAPTSSTTALATLPPPEPPARPDNLTRRAARIWWRDNGAEVGATVAGIGVGIVPPVFATLAIVAASIPGAPAAILLGGTAMLGIFAGIATACTAAPAFHEALHGPRTAAPPSDPEEIVDLVDEVTEVTEPVEVIEARADYFERRVEALRRLKEAETELAAEERVAR